jgi:hypothetical protein
MLKCKVFSATLARDRDELGNRVSEFIEALSPTPISEKQVLLSSDSEFHCLVIVLWWNDSRP